MKKFKKISIHKFELKGKTTILSADKSKKIKGGSIVGINDPCL